MYSERGFVTPDLEPRTTPGAQVATLATGGWQLSVPEGPGGSYRWAQLDDYLRRARSAFAWRPPVTLRVRARVSAAALPGTWGFGFWNDPFSVSLGLGGTARRLPALPNAAWFFYASPPNYLALRDTHPAQGLLAATFASPRIPTLALTLGTPLLPLLAWPPTARWLRRLTRAFVQEDAAALTVDPTAWHTYALTWQADTVRFAVDDAEVWTTPVAPRGPLGLVLWLDNQYAAFPPEGRLHFGTLPNPPAWLELAEIAISH